jgi:hypothetical protein
MKTKNLSNTFLSDLIKIENELYPFGYCGNCGKKRRLTLLENNEAWCSKCLKDLAEYEKKLAKEYEN